MALKESIRASWERKTAGNGSGLSFARMGSKGVALTWIFILISIFVIALVYIIFSYILYSDVGIANLVNTSTAVINNTRAQSTLTIINVVWQYWPLILIGGLILFGVVSSQRREPDSYYM